jgi:anaerobic dimethyl sulfoxide reductase subunit C (anchor subunit)
MEHSMTLVVFTFLSQMAIGAFATLFFLDAYKEKVSKRSAFISLVAILAVSVVAVIVSVFHLGHPFAAYRALLNFDDSWLTREIVFFPSFMLFVFLYTFVAKTKKQKQPIGWITIILGVVTIFCTAMIYTIPSVPAWNNGTTVAAFFTTALLIGPIFIQLLLSLLEKRLVNFNLYTTIVAFLAIILNVINLSILNGGLPAAVESAGLLVASPLFWVKIIALIAAFFIAGYLLLKKRSISLLTVSIIYACFLVSEFLGRMLFYSSGVHL